MKRDEDYMRIALRLALRAEGMTNPNPMVGAIVVKGGRVIGKGYHKRCGLPHAEVNALKDAGPAAKGATLYVTLEPCDHFGRTPPCTMAIAASGIGKVVIGMKDPNPINNGRGVSALKRRGIIVSSGVLEEEAKAANAPYIKFITTQMPYVTLKLAQSIDGKIATRTGDSKWITSPESRCVVHTLRSKVDAIMVGANTAVKDNPFLTPRVARAKSIVRIVVGANIILPSNANLFKDIGRHRLIIATSLKNEKRCKRLYACNGAEVVVVKMLRGRLDMRDLLKKLGRMGIMHLLVEGGGELSASLIEERLIDKLIFFIALRIIGGRDAVTSIEGLGVDTVNNATELKDVKISRSRSDIMIEAVVR